MKKIIFSLMLLGLIVGCHETSSCEDIITYSNAYRGLDLLILKDGKVVCSSGGDSVTTPYELWSGTKSFVGVMAAAAAKDGLLSLDEKAADTLAEWRNHPQKSQITLRQILTMTSGQSSVVGDPPSYIEAVLQPLNAPPGETFQYGPLPPQLFGEIMRRKLGGGELEANPQAYFDRRILAPLGITNYHWRNGKDGLPLMPQGAILSAEDWAKFGEFIRNGGRVAGESLVDETAFKAMFEGSDANAVYGFGWWLARPSRPDSNVVAGSDLYRAGLDWLPDDLLASAGAGGQRLFIIPSRGLVIVRQADLDIAAFKARKTNEWSDAHFLQLILTETKQ